MLVPLVYVQYFKGGEGSALTSARTYAVLMILAVLLRLAVMIPVNVVFVPLLFGYDDIAFIIQCTLALNIIQGFWDTVVPFIVVHRTPIFEHFRMW